MPPAAQLLCLLRLMLCVGGPDPGIHFVDTASVTAAYQPERAVHIAAPADLPPDPATLTPGLGVRTASVWLERRGVGGGGPRGQAGGGMDRRLFLPTGSSVSEIAGFVRFDPPGRYRLRLATRAPVRLSVASLAIYDSGGSLAGGLTPSLALQIDTAGWYPIVIGVTGSDDVRLDWQTPGDPGSWVPVPEAMLAH
jgi:hypothetical protein